MAGRLLPVLAIVAKDLRLFTRDRFYVLVSALGLVAYAALFWVLPASVEETVPLGVHFPGGEALLEEARDAAGEEGFAINVYPSRQALADAVAGADDVVAGLAFPEDFLEATAAGRETTVQLLLSGSAPEGLRPALAGLVRETAHQLAGNAPPVTVSQMEDLVVGELAAREPLALRDQLRPLLLFLVLMVEMFALASLVATEVVQRTASAVLVTPVGIADLLAAKAVLGTVLAFGQAILLALLTGTLAASPALVVVALLLGAVLVTGFGLVAGSIGQDFVAIVFWSVLFFVPLAIPAFALLFPGTPALWVRALPTWGLADTLLRATAHGHGWVDLWQPLALLAAWCVAAFAVGVAVLGRRVASL